MPRKGAATAAPPLPAEPTPEPSDGLADNVAREEAAEDAKPKRGSGRRRGGNAEEPPPPDDKVIEDWTKPAYADDPGEFLFDSMEDADEWYRVMFFGVEGTGKTTDVALVTRVVPKGQILMINAEAGAKKSALARHGVDTSRIALYPPKGQQLTFEGLERLFYRVQADLEADPDSWGAVVWDSATAIYQKLLDDVIEADMRKTAEILQRANKGRGGRAGNLTMRDRFETDRDDFAAMSNQFRLLLRKYRSLHCHLLITALERRDEDKKAKTVTIGPAVSPALQTDLLGYMDAVIRTQVNEHGVYFGRTQPTDVARGKDRLNVLPVEMVDPTIERIHLYVTGALTEDTDRAQRRLPDREVITRRSLAEGYEPVVGELRFDDQGRQYEWDGSDWVASKEADNPEPPKQAGRRTARSSTRAVASPTPDKSAEEPSGSAPDSPPDPGPEEPPADPPKRGGRRARGTTSAAAASNGAESGDASDSAEEPPKVSGRRTSKPPAANSSSADGGEKPARSSGRKSAADRAARAQVREETEGKGGPATRRASARAKRSSEVVDIDKPPF